MIESTARWICILLLVGVGGLNALAKPATEPQVTPDTPATSDTEDAENTLADLIPEWIRTIEISGDFRYRHAYTDDETRTTKRNRHRIRARVVVTSHVNDEVDVIIGLASGTNESALNTNQDLDGSFSSKNLWLDLAYFNYDSSFIEGMNIFGGKYKNPFFRVGNSDLLFDTDVRPEGIGGTYKTSLNEQVELFSVFGGHWLEERSTNDDTMLWAIQGGMTYQVPQIDGASVTAGAGYYDFGSIQGREALGMDDTNFRGNTSSGGVYVNDYNIFQAFGQVAFTLAGQPFKVFGDMLINEAAESDEDTGYLVGVSLGKCKNPGSWQLAYNYRDLEADATVAALVESIFGGGGTGVRGHKISVGCQVAKNIKLAANYMIAERIRSETTDHNVLQVEGVFKF